MSRNYAKGVKTCHNSKERVKILEQNVELKKSSTIEHNDIRVCGPQGVLTAPHVDLSYPILSE